MDCWNTRRADNGFVVSWMNDDAVKHWVVFEVNKPQDIIDMLYWIKEEIIGDFNSKHRKENIVIKIEENI
jgi:hypothetical protein